MEEPLFQLTPPKWSVDEATIARTFFSTPVGQKFLQMIRYRRPMVTEKLADDRRTQHENLQGYERCFVEMFHLLDPKQ